MASAASRASNPKDRKHPRTRTPKAGGSPSASPKASARYVVEKGSISIDGISLTVAQPGTHGIADFAIIPFTHEQTNVRQNGPPATPSTSRVDILAKYVESLLANHKTSPDSRLTITQLIEEGF
jgi:riboflavin synthase alpha subunit